MLIGTPKEIKVHEYRVGLTPAGVKELRAHGHQVLIQSSAGIGIGLLFSVPVAVGVTGLEIIVVIVQAYVFTLLSAVFIGMAIHAHH